METYKITEESRKKGETIRQILENKDYYKQIQKTKKIAKNYLTTVEPYITR
jgi:hypothetical protein